MTAILRRLILMALLLAGAAVLASIQPPAPIRPLRACSAPVGPGIMSLNANDPMPHCYPCCGAPPNCGYCSCFLWMCDCCPPCPPGAPGAP